MGTISCVGRTVRREFHYWRRTSPVTLPYEAYVPHMVAGWALPADADAASRVAVAERRLAGLARQVEHSEAVRWCVGRVEGIATSNVEGIVTTLRSLSLFESLRGKRARAAASRHGAAAHGRSRVVCEQSFVWSVPRQGRAGSYAVRDCSSVP